MDSLEYNPFPTSVSLYNNVSNADSLCFNASNTTNKVAAETAFFKTFTGSYNDMETFELTEEAKTKYLGNDDTQIGIYGGTVPFDSTPSNPQIKSLQVASKPVDGKLKVQVELK